MTGCCKEEQNLKKHKEKSTLIRTILKPKPLNPYTNLKSWVLKLEPNIN
jgi:hypothetical protein